MELDELTRLLMLLRRAGVVQYKCGDLEVLLAPDQEQAPSQSQAPSSPDAPQPDMYSALLGKRAKFPGNE